MTILSTVDFFSSNYFFILPIIFLFYSIFIAIFSDFDRTSKVKRIYYSTMCIVFVIILRNVNLVGLCDKGLWGLTAQTWSVVVFSIMALIFTIFIDNYIISGYVFKEFGFLGTKFIKEETTETVKIQGDYICSLEKGIQSSYDCIDYFKERIVNANIKSNLTGKFNFVNEFEILLVKYFEMKNIEVKVDVSTYTNNQINLLVNKISQEFNLSRREISELKFRLEKDISYYFKRKDYEVYHLVATSEFFPDKNISILIKYYSVCNLFDQYIIKNLLYYFEIELLRLKA